MGECAIHLHWTLMGFDFTLPAPPDPHDPDHLASCEPEMVLLVNDLPTVTQHQSWYVGADLSESLDPLACFSSMMPWSPRWLNPTASWPLCDSARFERSGVLLA